MAKAAPMARAARVATSPSSRRARFSAGTRPPSGLAPRRRAGGIRWDRVGRAALLLVLGVVVLLYIPPAKHWIEQRQTSAHQQSELEELQLEHQELQERIDGLSGPRAIERQARELGMVREGEQAIVVHGLPED